MANDSLAATPRRPFRAVRAARFGAAAPRPCGEATVLVADLNDDCRTVCAMLLRHSGFRVLEAHSGEEVVRLAHAARPRAIVMAAVLRGVDGVRALEVLKENPATAHVPVIVTSSVCGGDLEARARAAGCAAYLLKPCSPRRVLEEVRAVASASAEPAPAFAA